SKVSPLPTETTFVHHKRVVSYNNTIEYCIIITVQMIYYMKGIGNHRLQQEFQKRYYWYFKNKTTKVVSLFVILMPASVTVLGTK
uniref:Uncharacterized protein n=1 Tax=Amphimedon queenslandica TaxID=400682 RepID=A0A1X7TT37_AMPQE